MEPSPTGPPPTGPPPTGPPTADWPGFLRRHARELGSSAVLLKKAQALAWGPKTVELVLDLAEGSSAIPIISAALLPLLEKAWGGRKPELILRGGQGAAPEKLDALRTAPDLQQLQKILPGEFIEFRPAGPAEDAGDDEEAEDLMDEPGPDDD